MKTSHLITLSLDTELVCPFDPAHRFPLRDGLATETLKALEEDSARTLKREQDKIREALIANFEEEKKRIRTETERSQTTKVENLNAENTALQDLLKELRETLSLKAKSEADLRNSLEEAKALQETKIAEALAEFRKVEREKLSAEAEKRIESAVANNTEKMQLQLRKLELQRDQALRAAENIQRKMEQGSQQLQGEILELKVEEFLKQEFPSDGIEEIRKGAKGADVTQLVNTVRGTEGKIVWECKETKAWSDGWITKIKEDMLLHGGDLAVIVSTVLPDGISGFGTVDGVWVCTPAHLRPLSYSLRYHLLQLRRARNTGKVSDAALAAIKDYIVSSDFNVRVETMTKLMADMEQQISKERNAFGKQWKARETQVRQLQQTFVEVYGSLQGILGEDELKSPESLRLADDADEQAVNQ